jgi:hypothetical protein
VPVGCADRPGRTERAAGRRSAPQPPTNKTLASFKVSSTCSKSVAIAATVRVVSVCASHSTNTVRIPGCRICGNRSRVTANRLHTHRYCRCLGPTRSARGGQGGSGYQRRRLVHSGRLTGNQGYRRYRCLSAASDPVPVAARYRGHTLLCCKCAGKAVHAERIADTSAPRARGICAREAPTLSRLAYLGRPRNQTC